MSRIQSRAVVFVALFTGVVGASMLAQGTAGSGRLDGVQLGLGREVTNRLALANAPRARPATRGRAVGSMTPGERRAAVDAFWGDGASTAVKLQIFDTFWKYVDDKFAAFQGIDVDWPALRSRYRPEIAAGVSRGRFAAIINQLSLALRDSHTIPLDLEVNFFTVPEPGVPSMAVSGWEFDTS